MSSHYETLGLSPGATAADIKAAYHAKLKEFPAHTHPTEFKAVRAAYETLRKGEAAQFEDFLKFKPLDITLDAESLKPLKEKAIAKLELSLDEMIRATF